MADEQNGGENDVANVEFGAVSPSDVGGDMEQIKQKNLEMIYEIPVNISAELGYTTLSIKDLLNLGPGSVVELERMAGESIDLLVNGVLIGKGDVVVVNENFGLRITEIVCLEERLKKLSG